jgi:hypothetical protein
MRAFLLLIVFLIPALVFAKGVEVEDIALLPVKCSKVILTVKTPDGIKQFNHGQIEAIGLKRLSTTTFWPEDYGEFNGVLLRDVLKKVGIEDALEIKLIGKDGYIALIPREDWIKWDVILATRHEQRTMSIRTKGPLRIIYPKDIGGEIADSDMRIRWIWAIQSIEPVY